jgi:hypothetical protein
MQRLDGRRRAPFFDERFYTEQTIASYASVRRRYERAAVAEGLIPNGAPKKWILGYFGREAVRSLSSARKQLPAVAHLFRLSGCGEAFPYDEIAELLSNVSREAEDPIGVRLGADLPKRAWRRACAFIGERLATTRAAQARHAQMWEVYARRYRWDPKHASVAQFEGFVAMYARGRRYRTVSNLCSSLSTYFWASKVEDLTRSEKVRSLLVTIEREDARTNNYRPLFTEDLRTMVLPLDLRPLDVRDRVICLFNHFGPLFCTELSGLDTNLRFPPDQPDRIFVSVAGRTVQIGGVDDPELDVRIWVRRLLEIVPAGPLFPARDPRGDWLPVPLTSQQIAKIIRTTAQRAGITARLPSLALRKGFAIRASRHVGPAQTARQMGLKRTSSLEAHVHIDQPKRRLHGKRVGFGRVLAIQRTPR